MSQRENPDVSIVIPTYNAGSALVSAINSILSQAGVSTEIIIMEDGSSQPSSTLLQDNFAELINQEMFNDEDTIRYFEQINSGAYHARMNCIPLCAGRYIKFLDQDDILLPDALAREVDAFEQHIDVVLTNWQVASIDARGKLCEPLSRLAAPIYTDPIDDFLTVGGCYTSAALYRRETTSSALVAVTGFTPVKADDWLIFAQVCLAGATYKTIQVESYRWNNYPLQLSAQSTHLQIYEHYQILNWMQHTLQDSAQLSDKRKKLLAHYFAKQLLATYRQNKSASVKLLNKIHELQPNYQMQHGNRVYRFLCKLLGLRMGTGVYSKMKNLLISPKVGSE